MEKIKTADRRMVLIKAAILVAVPIPVTILFVLMGLIGRPYNLFTPGALDYRVLYDNEDVYPLAKEKQVTLTVENGGLATMTSGDSVLWKAEVDPDGKYRGQSEESTPYYTLFWLPSYFHALPLLRGGWIQDLSQTSMRDFTGFLGQPGRTYAFKVREKAKWHSFPSQARAGKYTTPFPTIRGASPALQNWDGAYRGKSAVEEIFFIDNGGAVAGRAGYDTSNGLMVYAVSFAQNGKSLTLQRDNMPRRTLAPILLPFVLIVATALAAYEIFWSSLRPRKQKSGLPPSVEFSILGYTAILVDLYFDFVFHYYSGDIIFLMFHLGMVVLLWYRLGWFALLPLMELILAIASLLGFGTLHQAFAFFPGSVGAWLVALMVQGRMSPGHLPDIIALRFKS